MERVINWIKRKPRFACSLSGKTAAIYFPTAKATVTFSSELDFACSGWDKGISFSLWALGKIKLKIREILIGKLSHSKHSSLGNKTIKKLSTFCWSSFFWIFCVMNQKYWNQLRHQALNINKIFVTIIYNREVGMMVKSNPSFLKDDLNSRLG